MIRVTVELIPFGVGTPQHLGTAYIANDGTGDRLTGHYAAKLTSKRKTHEWRSASVRGFKRASFNVWYLLYHVLRDALVDAERAVRA